jgi:hypothetical protein
VIERGKSTPGWFHSFLRIGKGSNEHTASVLPEPIDSSALCAPAHGAGDQGARYFAYRAGPVNSGVGTEQAVGIHIVIKDKASWSGK